MPFTETLQKSLEHARGLKTEGINQITGAPKWSEDAARQRVERARGLSNLPYSPFKGPRLAPLNRYQRRASEMVNAELRRRAQDDTYKTIRSEIDAASRDKTHNQVKGYIKASISDPTQLHDRFSNRYNQEVLSAMDDSAVQTWLEKLPQLSANAISAGAYHTGANQRARERLARDIGKGLHKEKALFKAQGYENAIQQANRLQDRHLSAGQLAAGTLNQDRQTTLDIAQKRSSLDREKTAGEFAGSTALRDIGNIEQGQKQREYDEAKLRHDEEQNYPWQQLQREAAIHQGSMPIGLEQIAAASYRAPPPANPYTVGAAGLADLTKTLIPGKKRGGPITQKFAEGGMPQFPKYTDADLPAMQNPEMDSIRESAQGLKNERNPDKAYYGALASTLLKNVHGSPLEAVGLGMEAGENARTNIMSVNDENKVRAAKLMEAINTSRVAQQKILADYSQTQQHNDRTHAYHMASLGETTRHNKAYEDILQNKNEMSQTKGKASKKFLYDEQGEPYAERKTDDNKYIHGLIETVDSNHHALNTLLEFSDAAEGLNTNPVVGTLANNTLNDLTLGGTKYLSGALAGNQPKLERAHGLSLQYGLEQANLNKRSTNYGMRQTLEAKLGANLSPDARLSAEYSQIIRHKKIDEEAYEKLRMGGATPQELEYVKKKMELYDKNPKVKKVIEAYEKMMGEGMGKEPSPLEGYLSNFSKNTQPDVSKLEAERARLEAELAQG
jgi:hypothetical protein